MWAIVPENVFARQAAEKWALAQWWREFAPPFEIRSVVFHHRVGTVQDGLRRHFVPKLLDHGLNAVSAHVLDEREHDLGSTGKRNSSDRRASA